MTRKCADETISSVYESFVLNGCPEYHHAVSVVDKVEDIYNPLLRQNE